MENNLNLKVVHTSPFPGESFEYPVDDIIQAWVLLNALATYDEFQVAKGIRADFSATQGLLVWDTREKGWGEIEWKTYMSLDELKALVNN